MAFIKAAVLGLLISVAFPNGTLAQDQTKNTAMVKALMDEGLTHDQAVRVTDQVLKNENIPSKESAMTASQTNPATKLFPAVPTTKILAIGRFPTPPTPEQVKDIFPKEVAATLQLYLDGKIDQWWIKQGQAGPVFLMNVTTVGEAHALLEKLPLGQAKLMEFDYIGLGPLAPLRLLLHSGEANGNK